MARLNLALDKAMTDNKAPTAVTVRNDMPPLQKQDTQHSSLSRVIANPLEHGELRKQHEINKKLNELLNQKDDEIQRLSEQVIELQLSRARPQSPSSRKGGGVKYPGGASPLTKTGKGKDYLPAGYSGITMVEEKLRISE